LKCRKQLGLSRQGWREVTGVIDTVVFEAASARPSQDLTVQIEALTLKPPSYDFYRLGVMACALPKTSDSKKKILQRTVHVNKFETLGSIIY